MLLTDEIKKNSSSRKSHILAGRMNLILEVVQQYSAIGDTASSANPIAALVWSSVKIVIRVMAFSFVFSLLLVNTSRLGGAELRKLFRETDQTLCATECLLSPAERL